MIREWRQLFREPALSRIVGAIRASQDGPACDGGSRRQTVEMFAVTLGTAVLLGVAGAYNTGGWPLGQRLLFWLISMCGGYGVAIVTYDAIHSMMQPLKRPVVATGVYVILGTPLIAVFVWLIASLQFHCDLTLVSFLSVLWPILMINVALLALKSLMAHQFRSAVVPVTYRESVSPMPAVRLLARLPAAYAATRIRAVSAEDHYLRVYTDLGEVLILMRLRDAVLELDGLEGEQTHRSWWVARHAVERTIRVNKRCDLMLTGDIRVPVSRSFQPLLRRRGWI